MTLGLFDNVRLGGDEGGALTVTDGSFEAVSLGYSDII